MKALGKGSIASIVQVGLRIAWIILWIAAVGWLVGALAYLVVLAMISAGALDASVLAPGDNNLRVQLPGYEIENPAGAVWPIAVPALLIMGVAIGGSLVIVSRLKRLFDNFTSGAPFSRDNADHLRAIWVAMLVIEIARVVLLILASVLITTFAPDLHGRMSLTIDISTWGSILILIVLAEVFREGARLKEEQELTI